MFIASKKEQSVIVAPDAFAVGWRAYNRNHRAFCFSFGHFRTLFVIPDAASDPEPMAHDLVRRNR